MCGDLKYWFRLWAKQAEERKKIEAERASELAKTKDISTLALATMGY